MKPEKNKLASALYAVFATVFVALLCYSLYRALVIYIPLLREQARYDQLREVATATQGTSDRAQAQGESGDSDAEPAAEPPYVSPYAELFATNDEMVGWLKIEDTDIDYPVMKSSESDPEFYLRRDFDGNYAMAGSLFVGGGCTIESDIFVIYGHNMSDDSMFGTLDAYKTSTFEAEHTDISFFTQTEERTYRVFAAFETRIFDEGDTTSFKYYDSVGDFSEADYLDIVESLRRLSLYGIPVAPAYPQQVLMLSTCSYHIDKGRFVVAAYRIA